jgi:hypothetical protein
MKKIYKNIFLNLQVQMQENFSLNNFGVHPSVSNPEDVVV